MKKSLAHLSTHICFGDVSGNKQTFVWPNDVADISGLLLLEAEWQHG